jgi:hypothetical protein
LSPIQKVETSAVTNTASAAATATIASKATATVEKAATIAEDTLTLTAQDFAKHKEVSQSAAKVVTNGTTSTSASKATSGSTTAGKSSQASSEVKTTETHKVSKNTEEAYSSNRETKAEAVIKQGNKGNLTNTQRRNAEVNYANEVKKGLHIKPAITEAERIKYSAGVAYTAPVGTQAEALRINNAKANKAKANAIQIGNNISQETYEKLMKIGR